jgi:hypothetical protein
LSHTDSNLLWLRLGDETSACYHRDGLAQFGQWGTFANALVDAYFREPLARAREVVLTLADRRGG